MPKQTSSQRHEVNRAEFRKWKLKILALAKRLATLERVVVQISNRTRARSRAR